MLENVEQQHEMSVQELSQDAKRMQETVEKQQSFYKGEKWVQETVTKQQQQQSLQEDAEGVQETVAKSHSVLSSLPAGQECAQEKLAVVVSSKQRRLARQLAVVDSPTSAALRTVSDAKLHPVVKPWTIVERRVFAFLPVRIAVVLH